MNIWDKSWLLPSVKEKQATRQEILDAAFDYNQPDWNQTYEQTKNLITWAAEQNRNTSRDMIADQIEMMLEANPKLMAQEYELYNSLYPNQAAVGEDLAADVMGRLLGNSSSSFPVPDSLVSLLRKSRLEADNARGLPISGVGSAAEAESIARLGSDLRQMDVNTALALSGKIPVAAAQAMSYTQPSVPNVVSSATSVFSNLVNNEYDRSAMKLGYQLYRKPSSSSSGLSGLVDSALGSFGSGFGYSLGKSFFG